MVNNFLNPARSTSVVSVYVISIPTATKRREHMQKELDAHAIPFRFFDAIHGEQVLPALERYGIEVLPNALTVGELGCLMSHVSLWQQLLDSAADMMTILEDDMFLGQDAAYWLGCAEWIPQPCGDQVIKLEKHEEKVLQGRSSIEVRNRKLRALRETHFASGAYTIGRHAAAEMLTLLKSKPIDQAVDHLLFCDYRLLHPKSVWQLNPAVCIQEKNLSSASSALGSYLEGERLAFAHFRKAKPTRFARSLRFLSFRYWAEKIQQWTSPSAVGFR